MSNIGNPMVLKSQYISIFGLLLSTGSPQSVVPQRFQRFYEGAHDLLVFRYLAAYKVAKVLICSCLGIFVSIYAGKGGGIRRWGAAGGHRLPSGAVI